MPVLELDQQDSYPELPINGSSVLYADDDSDFVTSEDPQELVEKKTAGSWQVNTVGSG